jgi:endonuclease/exonuclease/phosphatase family metal-dependent hydrolase
MDKKWIVLVCLLFIHSDVFAKNDPITPLVLCTQNIHRWGEDKKAEDRKTLQYLLQRISKANCDVVALQEIPAKSFKSSEKIVEDLAREVSTRLKSSYRGLVAKTNDRYISNGFLLRTSKVKILEEKHYYRYPLPALRRSFGAPNHFSRGPFGVLLEFLDGVEKRKIFVLTMHFKSRRNSFTDPMKTNYEGLRVEMSAALQTIAMEEAKNFNPDSLIVLGDRNADELSASSDVLSGKREFADFRSGSCIIDSSFQADCNSSTQKELKLVGLLEKFKKATSEAKGSLRYKGREFLYDEILIRPEDLEQAKDKYGHLMVGFEGEIGKGSDHRLLWVKLEF